MLKTDLINKVGEQKFEFVMIEAVVMLSESRLARFRKDDGLIDFNFKTCENKRKNVSKNKTVHGLKKEQEEVYTSSKQILPFSTT